MRAEMRSAATSVVVFALQAVIAVLLTRFLVKNLGVVQYSVVPLVNSFIPYLSLIAGSLGTVAGRELTISRRSQGIAEAQRVYTTAVLAGTGLSLIIAIVLSLASEAALSLLRVSTELRGGAKILLLAAGVSASASIVRGPLLAVPFSENRLDLENLVILSEVLIRSAFIALAFTLVSPSVIWVGLGMLAGGLSSLFAAWRVSRHLAPELIIMAGRFDPQRARAFMHLGVWHMVGQIGALLFWSTDLFVLSIMTSASTVGLYGTVAVWPVFLRGLVSACTSFLNPLLVGLYGEGDRQGVFRASLTAVRILGVGIAVPVGIVAGFAPVILREWIGPEVMAAAPVLTALVLPLCVNLAVVPLFGVHVSYGKLAVPGTVTLIAGSINILLSFVWARTWPVGLGVAVATAVALTAKNALFTPWYVARVQGQGAFPYYRALAPGTLVTAAVYIASLQSVRLQPTMGLLGLVAYSVLIAVVGWGVGWFVLTPRGERVAVRSFLESRKL